VNADEICAAIIATPARSAWSRGVQKYALEIIERATDGANTELDFVNYDDFAEFLLCGAGDWGEASYGGCFYVYDHEIAETLCSPSELKKCKNGDNNPNSRETWLDVQTRALTQAFRQILRIWRAETRKTALLLEA